jgi:signal transduction histidine kinase
MNPTYQQVLDLITNNPGNLIYHVGLALTIFGALYTALNLWRDDEFPQGRRMVFGLGTLLGIRLLLFLTAVLINLGVADSHILLPNADRAVMVLSLVIVTWLWLFPEPTRIADSASGLIILLVLTLFTGSQIWWSTNLTETAFNVTFLNLGWEILALLILGISGIFITIRKPNGWGYGFAMMVTIAVGHLVHILFPDLNSDYPGAVRLFELAGFPLLWLIPNRFDPPQLKLDSHPETSLQSHDPQQPQVEPQTFQAILALTDSSTPETTYQKLTKLLAETLCADICLLIQPPDENQQVLIHCGYDLIRETYIPNISIESEDIPMLISAMERIRPLRLPASTTSQDINNIAQALNFGRTGHLLAAFVPSIKGNDSILGIVLISPYSDRRWSRDDQAFLNKIAATLPPILFHTDHLKRVQSELEISKHNLQSFQELLKATQTENAGLQDELKNISEHAIQNTKKEVADLVEKLKTSQEVIDSLQNQNVHLEDLIGQIKEEQNSGSSQQAHLQEELKLALTEVAHLKELLIQEDEQTNGFQETTPYIEKLSSAKKENFTSITQDLRQPLSSIVGYTDLLLSESVGIIGASQQKFLERIKASTERIDALLDDLIQAVTLDTEDLALQPETVNLETVIDKAIVDTRSHFQKRGIVLRVDLLDEMPHLIADQDALQQILIHLLKNAGTATPVDGEIFLRTSIYQTDDRQNYILVQVADQGGGIPKDDLPRVFSRLYKTDNPLIQGIGDTGVGLSIVKALVEAHNGRIWVDTEIGKGSTFSLLIPISDVQAPSTEAYLEEGTPP